MLSSLLPFEYFVAKENGFKLHDTYKCNMEIPEECPHCGKFIYPSHLVSVSIDIMKNIPKASIFFCHSCEKFIFTLSYQYSNDTDLISAIYPPVIENKKINKSIEILSPNFVKIFNQAVTAENNGLDEICGMGYRKALEFLIKDYAISKYPDKKETIEKIPLSTCINDYCDNDKIKTLSKACAWIGNDETHYVRKHENYTTKNLKAFINAVLTFIESELSFDEAAQLIQS